jgi:hypothetical protein
MEMETVLSRVVVVKYIFNCHATFSRRFRDLYRPKLTSQFNDELHHN